MKKYLRVICSICNRSTDKLIDLQHAVPDRCTITLNCQGRLFPSQYISDAQITPIPATGTQDWYPRGTVFSSPESSLELISILSGPNGQIVIGVLGAETASSVTLVFEARAETPKPFQQFTFRPTSEFTTIVGVEDGISKKLFKYDLSGGNPDIVEVYLNGIRQNRGTAPNEFKLFVDGGTEAAVPNSIQFNSPVAVNSGISQVSIIVSKAQALGQFSIVFDRNISTSAGSISAWSNVSSVVRNTTLSNQQTYTTFTFDLFEDSILSLNTVLYPVQLFVNGTTAVPLANAQFLLSRKPYSQLDRYLDIFVPLSLITGDRDYLKYEILDGSRIIQVTKTALVNSYPTAVLNKFQTEKPIKTPIAGNDEQIVIDGKIIVGPDA